MLVTNQKKNKTEKNAHHISKNIQNVLTKKPVVIQAFMNFKKLQK